MFANSSLERIASFHGHICPELVIGCKFCEFVQRLINSGRIPPSSFSVISENGTSALDAIQVLLGTTVGNQRLQVMDYGKHNYVLLKRGGSQGWRLTQRNIVFDDERAFADIDKKIRKDEAELDDIFAFHKMINDRVKFILSLSPEEVFTVEEIENRERMVESTSVYLTCRFCGEQVLAGHSVRYGNMVVCEPCYKQISSDSGVAMLQ